MRRADVVHFPEDPELAIDGGYDGLDVARLCVEVARTHLLPGGMVVLQIGTLEQVESLRGDLPGFVVSEVRECERGVLVRLDLS